MASSIPRGNLPPDLRPVPIHCKMGGGHMAGGYPNSKIFNTVDTDANHHANYIELEVNSILSLALSSLNSCESLLLVNVSKKQRGFL